MNFVLALASNTINVNFINLVTLSLCFLFMLYLTIHCLFLTPGVLTTFNQTFDHILNGELSVEIDILSNLDA